MRSCRLEAIVPASKAESDPEATGQGRKPAQGQHGAETEQGRAVEAMLADLAYMSRFLDELDRYREGHKSGRR